MLDDDRFFFLVSFLSPGFLWVSDPDNEYLGLVI